DKRLFPETGCSEPAGQPPRDRDDDTRKADDRGVYLVRREYSQPGSDKGSKPQAGRSENDRRSGRGRPVDRERQSDRLDIVLDTFERDRSIADVNEPRLRTGDGRG